MNLSGVLLSNSPRTASPLPGFDETKAYLHTSEISHTVYAEVPGAIDVFVAYQSSWVRTVSTFSTSVWISTDARVDAVARHIHHDVPIHI